MDGPRRRGDDEVALLAELVRAEISLLAEAGGDLDAALPTVCAIVGVRRAPIERALGLLRVELTRDPRSREAYRSTQLLEGVLQTGLFR